MQTRVDADRGPALIRCVGTEGGGRVLARRARMSRLLQPADHSPAGYHRPGHIAATQRMRHVVVNVEAGCDAAAIAPQRHTERDA